MRTFIFRCLAALIFILNLNLSLALADQEIDFGGARGGLITTTGQLGGVMDGNSINIDQVTGLFTPSCTVCPTFQIVGGTLSFQRGALTGVSPLEKQFGSGGSVQITGGIPALGIPNGSVLLQGTFFGGSLSDYLVLTLFLGQGTDTENPILTANYGLGSSMYSFSGFDLSGGPLVYDSSTGLYHTNQVAATSYVNAYVPEPTVLVFLLTVLVLIGGALRRRLFATRM